MNTTLDALIARVREELRAEGPDGGGFSNFLIMSAINGALDDLAGIFTIRDVKSFQTTAGVNDYNLTDMITDCTIEDIIRVAYDNTPIRGVQIDNYLNTAVPTEGEVRGWLLWGNRLILLGEVEDNKEVTLWITRSPKHLRLPADQPETPRYANEALVQYAISACYREARDYDRANYHYSIYLQYRESLRDRSISQGQRDHLPVMGDSYWGPVCDLDGTARSDTNPGGI
jgi:hypothetical protein